MSVFDDAAMEELVTRFDVVEADVRQLSETIAGHTEAMTRLLAEQGRQNGVLTDIAAALDELIEDEAAGGKRPTPRAWVVQAEAEDWAELIGWVDGLVRTYELGDVIKACWPRHGGVVEELAALRLAWRQAAGVIRRKPKKALGKGLPADPATGEVREDTQERLEGGLWRDQDLWAMWHDRVLAPTISRLKGSFYPMTMCKTGHMPPAAPQATDRGLVNLLTGKRDVETLVLGVPVEDRPWPVLGGASAEPGIETATWSDSTESAPARTSSITEPTR